MEILSELMQQIGKTGAGELVDKVGLDPETASRAVPSGLEVIMGQLGSGAKGGIGGLLEQGMGALGGLLGGGGSVLSDPEGAASQLASKIGVDTGTAGKILSALLPMVLQFFQGKEGSGDSPLGGLGKLFG